MSFQKFKYIIGILLDFQQRKDRISDFFEKELMEDSWCIFTLGNTVEGTLINLLADEFDCWYSFKEDIKDFEWWTSEKHYGMENDIEAWLYSLNEEKCVEVNGKKINISSLERFYNFLVQQYNEKHNLTDSKI